MIGFRQQVAATNIGRILANLSGEGVDSPLECGSRFGLAGATVSQNRCGVGDHGAGAVLVTTEVESNSVASIL